MKRPTDGMVRCVLVAIGTAFLCPIATAASNAPTSTVFDDPTTGASCNAEGKPASIDPVLNLLKNRILPTPDTTPETVADLRNLPDHTKSPRAQWTADDLDAFAQLEDSPIRIEGYLVGVRREGAESTNCGATDAAGVDFHTWVVDSAEEDRTFAAVAEVSPRWRQVNSTWNGTVLQALVEQGAQVRMSGWPMFDQEHPEQIGKTRSTLWEIHPITKIEVATSGGWIELGDDDVLAAIGNTAARTMRALPQTEQLFAATASMDIPERSTPSARARRFGPLQLVHTRSPALTLRVIRQERELIRQESALGE